MPTIKFSHDWSKLNCAIGSLFTTIRPYPQPGVIGDKLDYYVSNEGKIFDVSVNDEHRGRAELLQVFRGPGTMISGAFIKYDTDGDQEWVRRISGYRQCLVLLFRRVE